MTQHHDKVPENSAGLLLAHKANIRALEDELCNGPSNIADFIADLACKSMLDLQRAIRRERAARVAAEAVRASGNSTNRSLS